MADSGISGQNFLRLLFAGPTGRGGAQAGVDQIPRQQAQQADLTVALQRMMQQQGQFDEQSAAIDRRFNTEQERLKANTAANLQFKQSVQAREGMRDFFEINEANKARINQQAFRAKLIEQFPQLAGAFGTLDAGGTAGMANSLLPDDADSATADPTTNPQRLSFWRAVDSRLKNAQIFPHGSKDGADSVEEFETAKLDAAITLARESGWRFMLGELLQKKANMETAAAGARARERFQSSDKIPPASGPPVRGPVRAKKRSSAGNLNPVEEKIAQLYEELGINA